MKSSFASVALGLVAMLSSLHANAIPDAITKATAPERSRSPTLHKYKIVNTQELHDLLASGKPIILLDARTPEHDNGQRLPGAKWLPHNASLDQIGAAIPSKDSTVVVYCSSRRCPASKYLAERLLDMGYTQVLKYPDGLEGWQNANYPLEQAKGTKR